MMGRGRPHLVVSDVDGCLAPEDSAAWNLDAFAQVAATVRQHTLPFTLCTGRPQPYVEVLMKLLDVRLPAICENGAVIYTLGDNRAVYGPGVTEEKLDGLLEIRRFITGDLLHRFPDAVHQFGKEAQISVFSADPSRIPALAGEVRDFATRLAGSPVVVNASHYYLNISLAGVDKGSALRWLKAELGIETQDVAAIGDTEGDIPLREEAGWFAAPANATAELRGKADYVSPHPDIKGLADILNSLPG